MKRQDIIKMEYIKFIRDIDKQIWNLRNNPEEESFSRLCNIAKQILLYEEESWERIFWQLIK